VYDSARASLVKLMKDEVLVQEDRPSVYLYEQVMNGQSQIGVVGLVHVDDYEADIIRKHEKTRRDKEDDRTRHVLVLSACRAYF
jgi:uncharacterized protein (DUF1015 family)